MKPYFYYIFCALLLSSAVNGQTPWDAIFMEKRELCTAVIYDRATFDQYWEGETLITNQNIGTFKRTSVMGMAAYGITDRINFIAMAPYMQTSSSGGQLAGVSGFQDLTLALKGRFFNLSTGAGDLSVIGLAGFSTPISNYLSDYMPYSLGLGCSEFNMRLTSEFTTPSGFYARGSIAYHLRGYTEIERDFYYNNGPVYSNLMNVPNAINIHGALGFLTMEGRLRLEFTYTGIKCLSGDDIRRWNRPQPTNKMMFDQIGGFAQYYFPKWSQFSLVAYVNTMVAGRNMGKFTNASLGATYQFKI